MSGVATAVIGGAVIGGVMSSNAQKGAADTAANAQTQSAQMGIDEQKRQFDALQALLKPYSDAGVGSLTAQQNLLGLNGNDAQASAVAGIQNGAQFKGLQQVGENSILQNASATGGLRGGNTQGALAQFSPQLLNSLIQQQYSNLGGITALGQNAAAGQGNAGMQSANAITQLLSQQGAAQAGNALAAGKADSQLYSGIGNSVGTLAGLYGSGAWKGF